MFQPKIIVEFDGKRLSGIENKTVAAIPAGKPPLMIGVHGGSYTCSYFDVPGHSLLEIADQAGVPMISLDRPSYGQSTPLAPDDASIARNAEELVKAIGTLWEKYKNSCSGVFIVGHSIGAATTITVASLHPSWPLLGIAVSGVGLRVTPGDDERWAALPPGLIPLPDEIKDFVMFGPPGSFGPDMPKGSHVANTTAPRTELIDITSVWPKHVRTTTGLVKVPVHYRQADTDRLWIVNEDEVRGFSESFTNSPKVDGKLQVNSGHCIDFHLVSPQFHKEQVDFAVQAAKAAR